MSERSLIYFGVPDFFGVLADPTRLSLTAGTHGFLATLCEAFAGDLLACNYSSSLLPFAGVSLLNSCFVAGLAGALASIT